MNNFFHNFLNIFNENDTIYDFYLKPNLNSIYNSSSEYIIINNIIHFPNFYFYYINTIDGFTVNIIHKYMFNWNNPIIIENKSDDNEYFGHTKFGDFNINREFIIYNFDDNFSHFLESKGFSNSYIDLKNKKLIYLK